MHRSSLFKSIIHFFLHSGVCSVCTSPFDICHHYVHLLLHIWVLIFCSGFKRIFSLCLTLLNSAALRDGRSLLILCTLHFETTETINYDGVTTGIYSSVQKRTKIMLQNDQWRLLYKFNSTRRF